MKTSIDCIPCFLRQGIEAVRFVTSHECIHEFVVREILRETHEMDFAKSPPEMGQIIHALIRRCTGVADPYRDAKRRSNEIAFALYPEMLSKVENSENPMETALRFAIAGNIIDFAYSGYAGPSTIASSIDEAMTAPLAVYAAGAFQEAVNQAEKILYLCDNAGEIVFDQLLIRQLPLDRVTAAVRGAPVLNDATMEDARATGLTDLVEVIDNGSDAPGTILESCSDEFVRRYHDADLIVSKGQGNYETLSDRPEPIFFLFKVKCPLVESKCGQTLGSLALLSNAETAEETAHTPLPTG